MFCMESAKSEMNGEWCDQRRERINFILLAMQGTPTLQYLLNTTFGTIYKPLTY